MRAASKLFSAALITALLGGLGFLVAVEYGFQPGNWQDVLAFLAIGLLILGGILCLSSTAVSVAALSNGEKRAWWFPINIIASLLALAWAATALTM